MSHDKSIEALVVELRQARDDLARLTVEVETALVEELRGLPAHFGYADVDAFAKAVRNAVREASGAAPRRRRRKAPNPPAAPAPAQPVAPAEPVASASAPAAVPPPPPEPSPEEMPPALPSNSGDSYAYRDALVAQREEAMRRMNDRATKPQAWVAWKKHLGLVDEALRASQ